MTGTREVLQLLVVCGLLAAALPSPAVAEEGAEFLVFCRDDFIPALTPLTEWRQASGIRTRVVPLSQIGADTTAVRNYIIYAWQNWVVRPRYVLIVAHPSYLRAKIYGSGGDRFYSDSYYGNVEDDFRNELAVGRFPARDVNQCQVMVKKTLLYEQFPDLADSLWMRRLTTVIREDYDSDDTIYWNNARYAAQLAGESGFVRCDSFSRARGHSVSHILGSVNDGTGFVLYRGRATNNWYSPFGVEPAMTNNGNELPVILSVTCATMALDPYDSMVGSAWVKAGTASQPRGGVAFVGNTHSDMSVAAIRGAFARGFFSGLFVEGLRHLGDALLRAKLQLYQEYPEARNDYRGFNIFGDPALRLWTGTPRVLTVTHPDSIPTGAQDLQVTVQHNGLPVGSALVCASMDSSVYAVGTTDGNGTVTLSVAPPDTGRLRLVVTGRNLYPYDGTIAVVRQSGIAGATPPGTGATRLVAEPSHFRTATVFRLAGRAGGWSLTIRDAAGRPVRVLGSRDDGTCRWDGNDDAGAPVPPGVYFGSTRDRTGLPVSARLTLLR